MTELPSGGRLAVTENWYFLFDEDEDNAWTCSGPGPAEIAGINGETYRPDAWHTPFVVSDQLYICAEADRVRSGIVRSDGIVVLQAQIPAGFDFDIASLEFVPIFWDPDSSTSCTISALASSTLVTLPSGRGLELDDAGLLRTLDDVSAAVFPEVARETDHIQEQGPWQVLVARGTVFRRRGATPFERIYGAAIHVPEAVEAMTNVGPDRILIFSTEPDPIEVRRDPETDGCSGVSVSSRRFAGWPPEVDALPRAAGADVAGDQVVVTTFNSTNTAHFLDLGSEQTVASVSLLALGNDRVVGIAGLIPRTFVLVTKDGELALLEDGELRALPVQFDDPRTQDVEAPHTDPDDEPRRWRSVSGAQGVVWAVGLDLIGRVSSNGRGRGARVEAYWLPRSGSRGDFESVARLEPIELTAVRAFCSDRVIVAGRDIIASEPDGSISSFVTRNTPLGLELSSFVFGPRPTVPGLQGSERPSFIVGPPARLALVTSRSEVHLQGRFYESGASPEGAATAGDLVTLGQGDGRLTGLIIR